MKERIVITFIALVLGLLITTLAFYFYQSVKNSPHPSQNTVKNTNSLPTPTPAQIIQTSLVVTDPQNEALVDKRTIQVKGKTDPKDSIIVSSNSEDVAVNPDPTGNFSVAITIDAGVNIITVRSISPNGIEKTDKRIVTYSTEDF